MTAQKMPRFRNVIRIERHHSRPSQPTDDCRHWSKRAKWLEREVEDGVLGWGGLLVRDLYDPETGEVHTRERDRIIWRWDYDQGFERRSLR